MRGLNHLFNTLSWRRNKKDQNGSTALYEAVKAGSLRDVKRLLRNGADPNITNIHHLTPLHQAAYWGETEIVDLLLKHGADPNADNGKGWTPLHSAAIAGGKRDNAEIIDLLLQAGANPDHPDKVGWTPQDYMKLWEENTEAAEKLKQHMLILESHHRITPFSRPAGAPSVPKH